MNITEYIIVGSGCTGAMAAQTLVEAGKDVTMLDVGIQQDTSYALSIPEKDFLTIRRTEKDQHQYLIGKDFEGIAWDSSGKGQQITPPRRHMIHQTDTFLPVTSDTFSPVESLAYGGLGTGWGIGCWEWSSQELKTAGLAAPAMRAAYNTVARRIGVSATVDDAQKYTLGTLTEFQVSPHMDRNHMILYKNYLSKKHKLSKQGFVMGRTPLALLTKDKGERKAYSYKDMDFYSDAEQSAYRPWMTINQLKKKTNFHYINKQLVTYFEEKRDGIIVRCLNITTKKYTTFRCKNLVLATGVLGTARIVLRSIKNNGVHLPLLSNPYTYVPCIQLSMIGQEAERHKLGFAQLSLFLDEDQKNFGASMASLYSYQSLMLFRIIRQVPLDLVGARHLLRYLSSGMIIMGIHQPDKSGSKKFLELVPNATSPTGDMLKATYIPTSDETSLRERREKKFIAAMRSMGVFAIKRIDPGFGSGIHYAGVLPFDASEKPFTLHENGRLHGTKRIFVADGSGFTYLPAKGLTFSLMANAHNVALEALHA
jgi:hypothetical protein